MSYPQDKYRTIIRITGGSYTPDRHVSFPPNVSSLLHSSALFAGASHHGIQNAIIIITIIILPEQTMRGTRPRF